MKKIVLLLLFSVGACSTLEAQKQTVEVFRGEGLNQIVLNSNEISRITITTAPVKTVTLTTSTDGEYFNNISLDATRNEDVLILNSRYPEVLRGGYDKLSAHKVFAMTATIEVPEELNVQITSNVTSVFMEGSYNNVLIELKSGSSFLTKFDGTAVINTYDGNIVVESANATVTADSRHGSVSISPFRSGKNSFDLTTINGDITVRKSN